MRPGLASRARAQTPAAMGALALVPVVVRHVVAQVPRHGALELQQAPVRANPVGTGPDLESVVRIDEQARVADRHAVGDRRGELQQSFGCVCGSD